MLRRVGVLLRDRGFLVIAAGVALALAAVDVAQAVGETVVGVWQNRVPRDVDFLGLDDLFGALAIRVGDRVLNLGPLLSAAIELGLVVFAIAVLLRWTAADDEPR